MRRRRVLVALGLLLIGAAAVTALLGARPPKGLFRAKYDRVRAGMTAEQVHAVMGSPYMAYASGGVLQEEVYGGAEDWEGKPACRPCGWTQSAYIQFANGRVIRKTWGSRDEPTMLELVLDRVGW